MKLADFVTYVVVDAEKLTRSEDLFGHRYTVDIMIEGITGQQATVRTGWLIPSGSNTAYLVTLYVKRRKP
jgi:hypothetical protein